VLSSSLLWRSVPPVLISDSWRIQFSDSGARSFLMAGWAGASRLNLLGTAARISCFLFFGLWWSGRRHCDGWGEKTFRNAHLQMGGKTRPFRRGGGTQARETVETNKKRFARFHPRWTIYPMAAVVRNRILVFRACETGRERSSGNFAL